MSTMTEQKVYRPIPSKFTHDTYTHWLIARQGDVAMYAKTQSNNQGCRWQYEVVIVRRAEAATAFGKPIPPRERLPSDEEFGRYGWHTPDWPRAWQIFERECQQRAPTDTRKLHPQMDLFRNSIVVPLFRVKVGASRPTPDGSMLKREQRPLDTVPASELQEVNQEGCITLH